MVGPPNIPHIPRDIIEGKYWAEHLAHLTLDAQVVDSMIEAVTFEIARVPEEFPKVRSDVPMYRAIYNGSPRLKIWFTFDEATVTLLGVTLAEPDE